LTKDIGRRRQWLWPRRSGEPGAGEAVGGSTKKDCFFSRFVIIYRLAFITHKF